MAEQLNITRSYLSEIENGATTSSSLKVRFLALPGIGQTLAVHPGAFKKPSARDLPRQPSPDDEKVPVRWIPLLTWAQAGDAVDYDGLPKHPQKLVPTVVDDPKAFAIEIAGDSQEPRYSAGDVATVVPSKSLRQNDTVIARLVDQGVVFKLYSRIGNTVRFSSYNPAYAPFEVQVEQIEWIYPVESVLKVIRK